MPETPLLGLTVDPQLSTSLFEQVYEGLRQRVVSGQFSAGERLPSSRKLAEELGVSRTTIVVAYDQLVAEGFAVSRPGSGLYVAKIGEVEWDSDDETVHANDVAISFVPPKPFAPGRPDLRLFPYHQWGQCVARVARTSPEALIVSPDPFGDFELRSEICRYLLEWRGVKARPGQILITAGSGDALELCIRTLVSEGDLLSLENPGYQSLQAFAGSLGLKTIWMEMDEQGAMPPRSSKRPKLAILTPSSQFPLGGAMPMARRKGFMNWATENKSWIIEDDYDSEFRYAGRPIPALASFDGEGRTIYLGSFTKVFSTGLRLGFVVVPEGLIGDFTRTLRRFGSKASIAPQRPLAEFMTSGAFYRHIRKVRRIYAERRAVLVDLIKAHLGDLVSFEDHRAGMHLTVILPGGSDDRAIAAKAATKGVNCSALSTYYASPESTPGLLLGFCAFTESEMVEAIDGLRDVIAN